MVCCKVRYVSSYSCSVTTIRSWRLRYRLEGRIVVSYGDWSAEGRVVGGVLEVLVYLFVGFWTAGDDFEAGLFL